MHFWYHRRTASDTERENAVVYSKLPEEFQLSVKCGFANLTDICFNRL
jgi:hypothetical protein